MVAGDSKKIASASTKIGAHFSKSLGNDACRPHAPGVISSCCGALRANQHCHAARRTLHE